MKGWGIDPQLEDKIVRPAWSGGRGASWFNPDDYPAVRLRKGQETVVKARLLIDAQGRVTKCTALSHVEAPEFQKIVCDSFMARGRFEPAELADGTKVQSYQIIAVRYQLAG